MTGVDLDKLEALCAVCHEYLRVAVWATQYALTFDRFSATHPDAVERAVAHADEAVEALDQLSASDSPHLAAWKRRSPRGGDSSR